MATAPKVRKVAPSRKGQPLKEAHKKHTKRFEILLTPEEHEAFLAVVKETHSTRSVLARLAIMKCVQERKF